MVNLPNDPSARKPEGMGWAKEWPEADLWVMSSRDALQPGRSSCSPPAQPAQLILGTPPAQTAACTQDFVCSHSLHSAVSPFVATLERLNRFSLNIARSALR